MDYDTGGPDGSEQYAHYPNDDNTEYVDNNDAAHVENGQLEPDFPLLSFAFLTLQELGKELELPETEIARIRDRLDQTAWPSFFLSIDNARNSLQDSSLPWTAEDDMVLMTLSGSSTLNERAVNAAFFPGRFDYECEYRRTELQNKNHDYNPDGRFQGAGLAAFYQGVVNGQPLFQEMCDIRDLHNARKQAIMNLRNYAGLKKSGNTHLVCFPDLSTARQALDTHGWPGRFRDSVSLFNISPASTAKPTDAEADALYTMHSSMKNVTWNNVKASFYPGVSAEDWKRVLQKIHDRNDWSAQEIDDLKTAYEKDKLEDFTASSGRAIRQINEKVQYEFVRKRKAADRDAPSTPTSSARSPEAPFSASSRRKRAKTIVDPGYESSQNIMSSQDFMAGPNGSTQPDVAHGITPQPTSSSGFDPRQDFMTGNSLMGPPAGTIRPRTVQQNVTRPDATRPKSSELEASRNGQSLTCEETEEMIYRSHGLYPSDIYTVVRLRSEGVSFETLAELPLKRKFTVAQLEKMYNRTGKDWYNLIWDKPWPVFFQHIKNVFAKGTPAGLPKQARPASAAVQPQAHGGGLYAQGLATSTRGPSQHSSLVQDNTVPASSRENRQPTRFPTPGQDGGIGSMNHGNAYMNSQTNAAGALHGLGTPMYPEQATQHSPYPNAMQYPQGQPPRPSHFNFGASLRRDSDHMPPQFNFPDYQQTPVSGPSRHDGVISPTSTTGRGRAQTVGSSQNGPGNQRNGTASSSQQAQREHQGGQQGGVQPTPALDTGATGLGVRRNAIFSSSEYQISQLYDAQPNPAPTARANAGADLNFNMDDFDWAASSLQAQSANYDDQHGGTPVDPSANPAANVTGANLDMKP